LRQLFQSIQHLLINLPIPKLLNELVIVDALLVSSDYFPGVDDLFAGLYRCVCKVVCGVFGAGVVQCHFGDGKGIVGNGQGEGSGELNGVCLGMSRMRGRCLTGKWFGGDQIRHLETKLQSANNLLNLSFRAQ
jgi:hypothetical protein